MNHIENTPLNSEKIKSLLLYLLSHNKEHMRENKKWLKMIQQAGFEEITHTIKEINTFTDAANRHLEHALKKLEDSSVKGPPAAREKKKNDVVIEAQPTEKPALFEIRQIGTIHTPYVDNAPYQPVEEDRGTFSIELFQQYIDGLAELNRFSYMYVLYYVHKLKGEAAMTISPPWAHNKKVGLFASRSPLRPNTIGLSIVRIKRIVKNNIYTSGLDVFDGTPLLDIKPYIKDLDSKDDADYGWIENLKGYEHLLLHIKGIPHEY
jgi:tRNA-Thr(GGU) m(6)t(6)A37 methyltransferase TsaA